MKIVCVLKSGGDYDLEYVLNLKEMVRLVMMDNPYVFECFTDFPEADFPTDMLVTPLREDLPGWWSKIEIFKLMGPTIYLDLDTALFGVGCLDRIVHNLHMGPRMFMMLKAFNPDREWASGIMAWNSYWGDQLSSRFSMVGRKAEDWDQDYIAPRVGPDVRAIQIYANVKSYKRHVRTDPEWYKDGPQIVCFHGRPRPHEVGLPFFARREQHAEV